ncbi:MAG TPA: 50S ribosomal protein L10 [Firmicutes bacterium]|nr:50S ribosomal protein L10 [Bacillota bacterium]
MGIRSEKEKKVARLKDDFNEANIIVMTDFRGLNVLQMNKLRRALQQEGVKYNVVKNTLARIAARETGLKIEEYLEGPTGIAYGYDDPLAPVKILVKFAREYDRFSLKGGVLENKILDETDLKRLSELPPKEVLLARVLGGFQAPLSGLMNVLQGNIRSLAYLLQALKEKREAESQ